MTDAWLDQFFGVDAVEIVQGDLMDAGEDAVVSPANSFGDMSGGVDKRIDDFFRGAAQERDHAGHSRTVFGRTAGRHGACGSHAGQPYPVCGCRPDDARPATRYPTA